MPVIAFWGSERFEVSSRKIMTLQNLTTSRKLKAEANNDTSGTPPINTTGTELQPVSFDVPMYDVTGVKVKFTLDRWCGHVGEKNALYIGGSRFGPNLLQLEEVSASNIVLDDRGRMRSAVMKLSFMEFVPTVNKKAYTSGILRSGQGGSVSTGGGSEESKPNNKPTRPSFDGRGRLAGASAGGESAAGITASPYDRAAKKAGGTSIGSAAAAMRKLTGQ